MHPEPNENDFHDPLWVLLGNAKKAVLPCNFADRVLQTVEAGELGRLSAPQGRRFTRWTAVGVAAGLLLLVGLQTLRLPSLRSGNSDEEQLVRDLISQGISSGDVELLAQLHEVVDAELASLWTEALQ